MKNCYEDIYLFRGKRKLEEYKKMVDKAFE